MVELGSGRYIKDLEDGLVGCKKGDKKNVKVKFPADYNAKELQNADAVFQCEIKKVSSPEESKVDDALAKSMGAENLEDLKSKVETQMTTEYSDLTKNLDKKNLFEKLQKIHDFQLPEDLIDAEFNNLSANYLQSQNPSSIDHQKEIKDNKLSSETEKKLKEDAENRIVTETTNAWSKYQSSESVLTATEAQLKAAEIANEGITLEYDSGNTRTTLELIQSRSLLLDSRISFAKAKRDFMISKFELAFQLGTLSSSSIESQ